MTVECFDDGITVCLCTMQNVGPNVGWGMPPQSPFKVGGTCPTAVLSPAYCCRHTTCMLDMIDNIFPVAHGRVSSSIENFSCGIWAQP